MTQASDILNIARNADDAGDRAAAITDRIDQDWEHEATIYQFDDESVLVVRGGQLNAFIDREAAEEDLAA